MLISQLQHMTRSTGHDDSFVSITRLVQRIVLTISVVELPGQDRGLDEDHEVHAHALSSILDWPPHTHLCYQPP
jgi:hypothetical protein